jgi:hypothetical protein
MRPIFSSFGLLILFLITFCPGCSQRSLNQQVSKTSECVVDAAWPEKPESFEWAQMPGIAVDDKDQIYICTRSRPAVQVYKTDGTFVRAWDSGDPSGSHFIRISPKGNIWTANITDLTVSCF